MLLRLLAFLAASSLLIVLPGPDTLVVTRALLRGGRPSAVRTAVGVECGLAVWVLAAALGLSALLRASHDGYLALRIAGGIYLACLGIQSLRGSRARRDADEVAAPATGRGGVLGVGYAAGLATDLLNPKVGVFFITFLPGFVPHGYPVALTSLGFGGLFVVMTGLYFVVFLAFAGRIIRWLTDARIRRRMDRVTGCVLIGFGARLATETGL